MLLGGSTGCGRTTMINKFVAGLQMEKSLHPPTTGVKNYTKIVDVEGGGHNGIPAKIKLDIWDSSGKEC